MIHRKELEAWCNNYDATLKIYTPHEPRVIIFGELHDNNREDSLQRKAQSDLLSKIQPPAILHEFMDGRTYDPQTKTCTFLKDVCYNSEDKLEQQEVYPYIKSWADQYQIPAVGIDLTKAQTEWAVKKALRTVDPATVLSPAHLTPVIKAREDRMAQRILQQVRKSDSQQYVIMGAYHMADRSYIHPELKKESIPYATIILNKKGN